MISTAMGQHGVPDFKTADVQEGVERHVRYLVNMFYQQVLHGCDDPNCVKKPCLRYRTRQSATPVRPPSVFTARSMALTLASQPNAQDLLCFLMRPIENLARQTPGRVDPRSLEQAVVSNKVISNLFADERETSSCSPNDVLDSTKGCSKSDCPGLTDGGNAPVSANQQFLWPLPQPLSTAKAWMSHVQQAVPHTHDTKNLARRSLDILKPCGYQDPTAHDLATTVRAICLLRMQNAVETADYHWGLIRRPPDFFINAHFGSLPLSDYLGRTLGVTRETSPSGLHHIIRRHLAMYASRFTPFAVACDQISKIQQRHSMLPLRVKWLTLGDDGFDQGGVSQEFFHEIATEVSEPPLFLFHESEENSGFRWINPAAVNSTRLSAFECLGVMMGLAVHNGYIMPLGLPKVFYKLLLNFKYSVCLQDIEEGWPRKYQSLRNLLRDEILDEYGISNVFELEVPGTMEDVNEEVSDEEDTEVQEEGCEIPSTSPVRLGFDMTLHRSRLNDRRHAWSLSLVQRFIEEYPENMDASPVTDENKHRFVDDTAQWLLKWTTRPQLNHLRRGIERVLPSYLLESLPAETLRLLIEGNDNVSCLQLCGRVRYGDDYDTDGEEGPCNTIVYFWSVMSQWPNSRVKKLLQFVTGSTRLPLSFDPEASPAFTIKKLEGIGSLPQASTCAKILYLPDYDDRETLRQKLELAVEHAPMFGRI